MLGIRQTQRFMRNAIVQLRWALSGRKDTDVRYHAHYDAVPVPEDVISYTGRILLEPGVEYESDPGIVLVGKGDLAHYIYDQLDVPLEDGFLTEVNLYGRITVEVFPDPDMTWP